MKSTMLTTVCASTLALSLVAGCRSDRQNQGEPPAAGSVQELEEEQPMAPEPGMTDPAAPGTATPPSSPGTGMEEQGGQPGTGMEEQPGGQPGTGMPEEPMRPGQQGTQPGQQGTQPGQQGTQPGAGAPPPTGIDPTPDTPDTTAPGSPPELGNQDAGMPEGVETDRMPDR